MPSGRSTWLALLLLALPVLVLTLSACAPSTDPWTISRSGPKLRLLSTDSCPRSLGPARDARNHGAWRLAKLVPASPAHSLICRYAAPLTPAATVQPQPSLYRQVRLGRDRASTLAKLIDLVSTKPPSGISSCPAAFNTATVIAFWYAHGMQADIWYSDTGCQTLDNGAIAASETSNPNFSGRVIPLINRVAPQAALPPSPAPTG